MTGFGKIAELDGVERARRHHALRALHAEVNKLGLEDAVYRDKLERVTGKRSASECTTGELIKARAAFGRKAPLHPHQQKAKALFIAAYNLGLFDEGTDAALDGFVRRQTRSERLAFLAASDAHRVAEALKAMLARAGCEIPAGDEGGMISRRNLVRAQWAKLHALGAVRLPHDEALEAWARNRAVHCHAGVNQWKRQELDLAAKLLGQWLRNAMKKSTA